MTETEPSGSLSPPPPPHPHPSFALHTCPPPPPPPHPPQSSAPFPMHKSDPFIPSPSQTPGLAPWHSSSVGAGKRCRECESVCPLSRLIRESEHADRAPPHPPYPRAAPSPLPPPHTYTSFHPPPTPLHQCVPESTSDQTNATSQLAMVKKNLSVLSYTSSTTVSLIPHQTNAAGSVRFGCVAECPRMSVDVLGTSCDQCRSMVQYSFTSTETRRLVRTDSPGRPPRLSHSSSAAASHWKYPSLSPVLSCPWSPSCTGLHSFFAVHSACPVTETRPGAEWCHTSQSPVRRKPRRLHHLDPVWTH